MQCCRLPTPALLQKVSVVAHALLIRGKNVPDRQEAVDAEEPESLHLEGDERCLQGVRNDGRTFFREQGTRALHCRWTMTGVQEMKDI